MDFDKYSDLENHGYFQPPPRKTDYASNFKSGYKAGATLFDGIISVIGSLFSLVFMLLKGLYSLLRLLVTTVVYLIAGVRKKMAHNRNLF